MIYQVFESKENSSEVVLILETTSLDEAIVLAKESENRIIEGKNEGMSHILWP